MRFTREAYHRMVDVGILNSDDRVELLDGEILMMSPIGPEQGEFISRLNDFFVTHLPDDFQCRVQLPIVVSDHSEPEPDLAVVRRHNIGYRSEHPSAADIVLLIEVASTSLGFDLGTKLRLYAGSQIAEYWVVDVDREVLVVHREPHALGYRSTQEFRAGATIAPLQLPDCQLNLNWLFR